VVVVFFTIVRTLVRGGGGRFATRFTGVDFFVKDVRAFCVSATCTAPPPTIAPPTVHAQSFAKAIRTDMMSLSIKNDVTAALPLATTRGCYHRKVRNKALSAT
jgi:hypothetical protein